MILKEFAKKHNLDSHELLDLLVFEKFPIQTIEDEIDDRLLKYLLEYTNKKKKTGNKNKKPNTHFEKYTVPSNKKNNIKIEPIILLNKPYSIADCISLTQLSASQFINFFLKKKKLYSINTILSKEEINDFAKEHNITIIEKDTSVLSESIKKTIDKKTTIEEIETESRPPIVTIVGHVDHGKTTLLDTIRKQAVAKTEKGGITQHIGAYEIKFNNQDITFLDTPGHEAFTALRLRGITIADIGILVVAADEGVMPQTVESIKMLKELNVQIILAITKIDKIENNNYDHIFQKITSFNLVPEAWGGDLPVVELSAKKNIGIQNLLESITLIAEIIDLKVKKNVPAVGYVLETRMEKGKGVVATILLQEGRLKTGSSFYVESVWGKVNAIQDSLGRSASEILPGRPYVISGFSDFPKVGGSLIEEDVKIARKLAESYHLENKKKDNITMHSKFTFSNNRIPYNIILKTDVFSSLQAIEKLIEALQLSEAFYCPILIHQGVGELTENDINIAINSKSVIYLFSIKKPANKDLIDLIEKNNINVNTFDIIYHMIEHIEKEVKEEKNKPPMMKKIGDLTVIKLFHIKGIGTIVGFKVNQGIAKLGAQALVYRNKILIGKGIIRSLQKEKNSVKELSKGNEGALSLPSVSNFQENDFIEVYTD